MIVDPDFIDHWKTRMLVAALGDDELAPIYVLRLWAHCQNRKTTRFGAMSCEELKEVCRYSGNAELLERGLVDSAFLVRDGLAIDLPRWAARNAGMVASWSREGRQLDVSASEWLHLRAAVFERDGYQCVYCGDMEKELDCDHAFPLSRGGKSVMENLVAACYSCNRSKGAKTPEEWGRTNG